MFHWNLNQQLLVGSPVRYPLEARCTIYQADSSLSHSTKQPACYGHFAAACRCFPNMPLPKLFASLAIMTSMRSYPLFLECRHHLKVGWRGKFFLADQNQHVSKPTWDKLQCNRHSRSVLKAVLKMANLAPSEKTLLKGRSLIGHLYDV